MKMHCVLLSSKILSSIANSFRRKTIYLILCTHRQCTAAALIRHLNVITCTMRINTFKISYLLLSDLANNFTSNKLDF